MRYMMLVYAPPIEMPLDPAQAKAALEEHMGVHDELMREGVMKIAERLYGEDTATTVSVRDGKIISTDGPFVETKEQLGGVYVFECEDLDAAIAIAARIPTSRYGHLEIRPVMVAPIEAEV